MMFWSPGSVGGKTSSASDFFACASPDGAVATIAQNTNPAARHRWRWLTNLLGISTPHLFELLLDGFAGSPLSALRSSLLLDDDSLISLDVYIHDGPLAMRECHDNITRRPLTKTEVSD